MHSCYICARACNLGGVIIPFSIFHSPSYISTCPSSFHSRCFSQRLPTTQDQKARDPLMDLSHIGSWLNGQCVPLAILHICLISRHSIARLSAKNEGNTHTTYNNILLVTIHILNVCDSNKCSNYFYTVFC